MLRCGDGERREAARWPDGERWRRDGGGGEAEEGGRPRPGPGPDPEVPERELRDPDELLSLERWEEGGGPERPLLERYMAAAVVVVVQGAGREASQFSFPALFSSSARGAPCVRVPDTTTVTKGARSDTRTKWRRQNPGHVI